jgi:hypothetical protein
MTTRIINPFPFFLDRYGDLLNGGKVYIGTVDLDPETNPIAVFYDEALTVAATQPLRVMGGHIVNGGDPTQVYTAADDYSIRVRNIDNEEVFFAPSVNTETAQFQPIDADLTAIAALSTTAYGRALLTLANQAALRAATGIPDPLPAVGGTVSGNIIRAGAGAHLYLVGASFGSGRVFVTEAGESDPTTLAGDIWFKKV